MIDDKYNECYRAAGELYERTRANDVTPFYDTTRPKSAANAPYYVERHGNVMEHVFTNKIYSQTWVLLLRFCMNMHESYVTKNFTCNLAVFMITDEGLVTPYIIDDISAVVNYRKIFTVDDDELTSRKLNEIVNFYTACDGDDGFAQMVACRGFTLEKVNEITGFVFNELRRFGSTALFTPVTSVKSMLAPYATSIRLPVVFNYEKTMTELEFISTAVNFFYLAAGATTPDQQHRLIKQVVDEVNYDDGELMLTSVHRVNVCLGLINNVWCRIGFLDDSCFVNRVTRDYVGELKRRIEVVNTLKNL